MNRLPRSHTDHRGRPCRCYNHNHTSETDLSEVEHRREVSRAPSPLAESDLPSSVPFMDDDVRRRRRRFCYMPDQETRAQVIPVFIVSIGNFIVGFSLAYHALADFLSQETLSRPLIQNLFCICGIFGAIFLGFMISWPRRRVFSIVSVAQILSWVLVLLGKEEMMMIASRSVAGICSGITVGLVQVYIGEIAHPTSRGLSAAMPNFSSILGSLICFSVSRGTSWYYVAVCGLSVSVAYTVLILSTLPESFRYLISKGKSDAAMKCMEKLRGRPEIHPEFNSVQDASDLLAFERKPGCGTLFKPEFYRPVFVAGMVMFFGQFSGIDGVLLFAFERYKDDAPPDFRFTHFPVVVLYCVQLVSTLTCAFLVDKLGKKMLLLISTGSSAVAGLGLGLYILFEDLGVVYPGHRWNWVPVACVIIYTGAFSLGLGPVPWMLFGELLPSNNKGLAVVVIGLLFWIPSLGINLSFTTMQTTLYLSGTLWFYTIFCIFGYLFVLLSLPDWKSVSLETIQLHFTSKKYADIPQRF